MKILGFETSCDETAISLIDVQETEQTVRILGNTVHSQIPDHVPYGGVFPMLAKREHDKNLPIVLEKTLAESGIDPKDIDYVSVTRGPGLEPALWTGILFARDFAKKWQKLIVPCNHMEGHILTALIKKEDGKEEKSDKTETKTYRLLEKEIAYPALSLLISGGHTQIVLVKGIGSYEIVGETRDDAIGECFDKVARTLGLAYPGGPKVSKLAAEARAENIMSPEPLPRPMTHMDNLDFSFSGLKTAVLYLVQKIKTDAELTDAHIQGICREVEDAVTDVIVMKMRKAMEQFAAQTIIIGGGVIANTHIRKALENLATECNVSILLPQFDHATDNGLMIALAGYYNRNKAVSTDTEIKALGTLPLGPRA